MSKYAPKAFLPVRTDICKFICFSNGCKRLKLAPYYSFISSAECSEDFIARFINVVRSGDWCFQSQVLVEECLLAVSQVNNSDLFSLFLHSGIAYTKKTMFDRHMIPGQLSTIRSVYYQETPWSKSMENRDKSENVCQRISDPHPNPVHGMTITMFREFAFRLELSRVT